MGKNKMDIDDEIHMKQLDIDLWEARYQDENKGLDILYKAYFELGKMYLVKDDDQKGNKNFQRSYDLFKIGFNNLKPHFTPDSETGPSPEDFYQKYIDFAFFTGDRSLVIHTVKEILEMIFYPPKLFDFAVPEHLQNISICYTFDGNDEVGRTIKELRKVEKRIKCDVGRFNGGGVAEALDGIMTKKKKKIAGGLDQLLLKFKRVCKRGDYVPVCEIACVLYSLARMKGFKDTRSLIKDENSSFIPVYFDKVY